MMALSDEMMLMLTNLDEAWQERQNNDGNAWVNLESHPKQLRAALVRYGLAEKHDAKSGTFRITPAGQTALMTGYAAGNTAEEKAVATMSLSKPPISVLFEDGCKADGCTICVYKQAIDVLAAKVPGVRELVDALQTIENGRR